MKSRPVIAVLLLCSAVAAPAAEQIVVTRVDVAANGSSVSLAPGRYLEIVLPENGTTGFLWSDASAHTVSKLVDDFSEVSGLVPGQGGLRHFLFRAVTP